MWKTISCELRRHAPFTALGALIGVAVAVFFVYGQVPRHVSHRLFSTFHPLHVLFSAIATTAVFRIHGKHSLWATVLVGFFGAIAIGTLSDSLIPYLGELLIGVHDEHMHAEAHIGFIELWWLVNPLAILGVIIGILWSRPRLPHGAHVLLSTGASLFHVLMGMQEGSVVRADTMALTLLFLFLAVWAPCCFSDIAFPMLFCKECRNGQVCPHELVEAPAEHDSPGEPEEEENPSHA